MHPEPEPETSSKEATTSSLLQRLTNVFVSPGEVFEEVKASPVSHKNWLVPLVLSMIMGVVFVLIAFSQPSILQEIRNQQEKAFQENIEKGKMTEEQADQARQGMEKLGPVFMKAAGSVGALIANVAFLFGLALGIFLLGVAPSPAKRWPRIIGSLVAGIMVALSSFQLTGGMSMKLRLVIFVVAIPLAFFLAILFMMLIDRINPFGGYFSYMKAVEVVGLAAMISLLSGVIALLLVMIKGSMMVSLGPALLLDRLDATNTTHQLLAAVNIMTFWYVAVLASALSRLSSASFAKAAIWLFGFWFVFKVGPILVFSGLG
jgi:hypothetical protein